MCFYSPVGKAFRSQISLQKHLAETPNSPPLSFFRFNISADDFKDNALPGEPLPIMELCKNRHRLQETDSVLINKRRKLKLYTDVKPIEDIVRSADEETKIKDVSQTLTIQSSVTSAAYTSGKAEATLSTDLYHNKAKLGGMYRYKSGYSFIRILSSLTSYIVLWKNANIMQKFLADASRLKEKSEAELKELRVHLHRRKLNPLNLSKYPEGALRAFFFLLRNREAPPSLSKEEVLDLCSRWSCKKRHHWCFSEARRMRDLEIAKSKAGQSFQPYINLQHPDDACKVVEPQVKNEIFGAIIKPTIDGIAVDTKKDKEEDSVSVPVEADRSDAGKLSHEKTSLANTKDKPHGTQKDSAMGQIPENYAQATYAALFGEDYPTSGQEIRCSSATYGCASTIASAETHNTDISFGKFSQVVNGDDRVLKSTHGSTGVLNHVQTQVENMQMNPEQALQISTENFIPNSVEQQVAGNPAFAALSHDSLHPVVYCEQPQEVTQENFSGQQFVHLPTPCISDEGLKCTLDVDVKNEKLIISNKVAIQKAMQTDYCRCDTCFADPTFCYGCQCSLCRAAISPEQSWNFLHCPACSHVCHLECALKARKAGVIKEMSLDGEFLCPSCLRKRDLISFWKERVKAALVCADTSMLEKQLFSAVLVLNGTQREMYQSVHEKVRELHSSLLCKKAWPGLTKQLSQIQKDVDELADPQEQIDGFEEIPDHVLERFTATDLLVEESKVLECKKKAELDHAEWLQAKKTAAAWRSNLKDPMEQIEKMEEEAKLRADCARASKKHLQRSNERLKFLKANSPKSQIISKNQVEKYRAILDFELSELRNLQDKVGSYTPDKLSMLLEGVRLQKKRVEFARAIFEHLLELSRLFI